MTTNREIKRAILAPTSLPHNGTETSVQAAESMEKPAAQARLRVYNYICGRGEAGATCDEAEHALGMSHQTASARVYELKAEPSPLVADSGVRRKTRSGRSAKVWVRQGVLRDFQ